LTERNSDVAHFFENIQALHRAADGVGNDLTGDVRRIYAVT
jgi:hypothetical protein